MSDAELTMVLNEGKYIVLSNVLKAQDHKKNSLISLAKCKPF